MRQFLILCALACATLSLGLEKDLPNGAKFFPEQGQDQVAQQAKLQGVVPVVGSSAPDPISTRPQGSLGSDDSKGSFQNANMAKDQASFAAATNTMSESKNGRPWWSVLFLVLGAMMILGLGAKAYMDKVAPVPDRIRG
ncbi:MAG: hypothetical protein JSS66_13355 [Armatimonadetes bacterium]|nr:hypothetical protein [Armatimonadota bacterium]